MTDSIACLIPAYLKDSEMINVNVTDMEGYFTYVNKTFQERFSFISDNFIGFNSMDTVYEADHQTCINTVQQCFLNPKTPIRVQLRKYVNDYDNFEWTDWEFSVLFNLRGCPVGILCVGYSITEQKNLIQKLISKNQMLESVAQSQAHQLRGPITSLQMLINMLNRNKDSIKKEELALLAVGLLNVDESILKIINMTVDTVQKLNEKSIGQ